LLFLIAMHVPNTVRQPKIPATTKHHWPKSRSVIALALGLLLAVLVRLLLLRHAGVVCVRRGDHPEHLASDLVLLRGVVVRGLALGLYGRNVRIHDLQSRLKIGLDLGEFDLGLQP
jgi:hypothetical protein